MSARPAVSVIMPAYNAGSYIAEAIESILSQSFRDWELIVVDDGSSDKTASIVEQFLAKDSRMRLLKASHQGVGAAANFALREARAEIIARLDADDIALPKRIELQVEFLAKHPEISVVASKVEIFPRSSESEGLQTYVDWTNLLLDHGMIFNQRFVDAPMIQPSVCFRRNLIDLYGCYTTGGAPEDYEMWLRWLDQGVRFAKISEVLTQWRDHALKLTRTSNDYSETALWEIKGKYFARWFERAVDEDRPVVIWGSGRKTRSRLKYLEQTFEARPFVAYIDIDEKKVGKRIAGVPVLTPDEAMMITNSFILVMVGSRGAREKIDHYLASNNRIESQDFVFLA